MVEMKAMTHRMKEENGDSVSFCCIAICDVVGRLKRNTAARNTACRAWACHLNVGYDFSHCVALPLLEMPRQ